MRYVRGLSFAGGFQTISWLPGLNRRVSVKNAFGVFTVRETSSLTVAGSFRSNRTWATSRKWSPFGLTVVSRSVSPLNCDELLPTCSPARRGALASIRSGCVARTVERYTSLTMYRPSRTRRPSTRPFQP